MSEVREFFRICPACGRRFHIKLVSKKLTDERKDVEEIKKVILSQSPQGYYMTGMSPVVVEDTVPITIDVEDFQYSYKCKHCGHEWSEMRTEESKA
jgi:hypothetical protein